MANQNLKNALQQAGLTVEEFADIVQVDPKTVQRWVAGSTTPYRRHRTTIARALNLNEHELWPDETSEASPDYGVRAAEPTTRNDVAGTWAHTTQETAPDPVALIENSEGPIDILDNGRGIELTPNLLDTLVRQADVGRMVRILTSLPKPRLEPLIGHQHMQVRVLDARSDHTLLRAGDTMLLTFNLAAEGDQPPPLLKLEPREAGGLHDRLTTNFQLLWNDGTTEQLTDPGQLDAFLTNATEDEEDSDAHGSEGPTDPSGADEQPQRRWPRRPN